MNLLKTVITIALLYERVGRVKNSGTVRPINYYKSSDYKNPGMGKKTYLFLKIITEGVSVSVFFKQFVNFFLYFKGTFSGQRV